MFAFRPQEHSAYALVNRLPHDELEAIKNNVTEETREKPHGVGFFFMLAISEISGKKPHPPWGFCRDTPVDGK